MILFFGTRTGDSKTGILKGISCPFCNQPETLIGYRASHYVHLFWIPIYRLSSISEIQCKHCKKHYAGNELTTEMKEALEALPK
jgi:hypothetical protein